MSRLESAMDQFNQALDRLDRALRQRGAAGAGAERGAEKALREVQALREDRGRLAEALQSARTDYAALEAVSEEVEERLDSAIRDIKRALGAA
jgi:chromosome segregation ATPase